MEYGSEELVAKAGKYLYDFLLNGEEGLTLQYSSFYGSHPDLESDLKGIFDDDDVAEDEKHIYLEWAAHELQEHGYVKIQELDTTLMDGEPDYSMSLTDAGREMLKKGKLPRFHGLDL